MPRTTTCMWLILRRGSDASPRRGSALGLGRREPHAPAAAGVAEHGGVRLAEGTRHVPTLDPALDRDRVVLGAEWDRLCLEGAAGAEREGSEPGHPCDR